MNLAEMREGHLETGEPISYMQPGGGEGWDIEHFFPTESRRDQRTMKFMTG